MVEATVGGKDYGPVFLILATYAILLLDSAKNSRWPEFSVRGSILAVLVAHLFLLPSSAGAFLLGPLERIHSALDNLPEGITVGIFLLLFHLCHRGAFSTSDAYASSGPPASSSSSSSFAQNHLENEEGRVQDSVGGVPPTSSSTRCAPGRFCSCDLPETPLCTCGWNPLPSCRVPSPAPAIPRPLQLEARGEFHKKKPSLLNS